MDTELFENTPVPKAYIKLALPVVLSGVLSLVYNLVDTYFVASIGDTNVVAAVALCAPIFTLLVAMGDILGLGGASVISRKLGNGESEDAKRFGTFCLFGSIVIGLVMTFLLIVFQTQVLNILGANEDTFEFAKSYLTYISLGAPFIILSLTPSNLLRTEGLANESMIGSITGSVVNMILDPVFIFGLHMGVAGAAIATVLGNMATVCVYIFFIVKRSKILSFSLKGFHISGKEAGSVLKIGIPSSVTNVMSSIAVIMLNHFLLAYGTDKVAVMGIVSKITIIVIMIMVGIAFGGQPLFGYLYGAQKKERMKETLRFSRRLIICVSAGIAVILAVIAPFLIKIFMDDEAIIALGAPMLRIVLIGMPFSGFTMITTCVFQATGKALPALLLSTARQGYVYVIMLFILNAAVGYYGVICAQPAAEIITAGMAVLLFRRLSKEIDAFTK